MSRKILHKKLQIWETQAHQNESYLQKYFMFIHFWFYFLIFLFWWGDLKFWISIFHQTNLIIWWKNVLFFKIESNKNVSNFVVYTIKFIWFNPEDIIYNIYNIRYMKYNIMSPWFNKLTCLCISGDPSIVDWFN